MSHTQAKSSNSYKVSSSEGEQDPQWYKDAIIYELHIKAFFDSNADGIGDFEGLLQKLDYLQDLGITAIWLLPFYPSPLRDDGYDIADYYSINKSYGDIEVFKRFIEEAHKRGLKVITELVINHTSDQHPWFQKARKAPAGSPERDFYVWTDDPNKYKDVRIIFTDTEPSNWTWDPVARQYYWHRFFAHQPDLNFDNPEVQKEVFKMLDYWFDMGVDGFRLDAIPYLFERENTNCENLPPTHEFLKRLRKHVDEKYENKLLLAEANMWPEDSVAYFGDGDECHMNYHFPIMPRMFMAVKMEDRYPIIDIIDQTPEIPENCQWGIFLRNHDELTLEMVTDEERDYMYKMYTKDPQAKINVGIRHRLAPLLENNRAKIELMNVLLFSLPGTPIIYYGDEIGMGDNYYLGDRDGVRTPMQWNADRNAGFSKANPQKLYLPTIIDPEYRYEAINVEAQQGNSNSLLWWMKRIISMRKRFKAFGRGKIEFLSPRNAKVIAYTRSFEDEEILVLGNLSRFPQAVELDLEDYAGYIPREVFSRNQFPRIGNEPYLFTMAPHGYFWFVLEREKDYPEESQALPNLELKSWSALLAGETRKELETKILPQYLQSCSWFSGKTKVIQSLRLNKTLGLSADELPGQISTLDVEYNEGLPETYQLALAFVPYHNEAEIKQLPARACIAQLNLAGTEGLLVDGYLYESFQYHLYEAFQQTLEKDGLVFSLSASGSLELSELWSKTLEEDQNNTSVIFSDSYILKLYRKLDTAQNSDVEITRFLCEEAKYKHVPPFLGTLKIQEKGKTLTLGMLQKFVPNQGDAQEYVKDAAGRYFERVIFRKNEMSPPALSNSWLKEAIFDRLPQAFQELIGGVYLDRVQLLGQRTAQMHIALASHSEVKDFETEDFSEHYQRSVFSALQSLTRSSFQILSDKVEDLPASFRQGANKILNQKNEVLNFFKQIFAHKVDCLKTRTHGDLHLGQVLWTGKDFVLLDFEGDASRSYSERRLKRSPLRDVASMLRSFHHVAYHNLLPNGGGDNQLEDLKHWAEAWYYNSAHFYLHGYLNEAQRHDFLPKDKNDINLLLDIFLMEKAVLEMQKTLAEAPNQIIVPLQEIARLLEKNTSRSLF